MCVVFVKQKTAYVMRISDWSSGVCSSDLTFPTASGASGDERLACCACNRWPSPCHQVSSQRVTVFGDPVPRWARMRSTVGRSPASTMASAAEWTSDSVMPRAMDGSPTRAPYSVDSVLVIRDDYRGYNTICIVNTTYYERYTIDPGTSATRRP